MQQRTHGDPSRALSYIGTDADVASMGDWSSGEPDDADRIRCNVHLAWHLRERDPPRAAGLAQAALQEPLGETACAGETTEMLAARAELVLGQVRCFAQDADQARVHAESALSRFAKLGDPIGSGDAHLLMAQLQRLSGNRDISAKQTLAAVEQYARGDDMVRAGVAELEHAFDLAFSDLAEARAWLDASHNAARCANHPYICALRERVLAQFEQAYGQQALRLQRVYHFSIRAGAFFEAAMSAGHAAGAFSNLQDLQAALEWAENALAVARPRGLLRAEALALMVAAEALRQLGRPEESLRLYGEAKSLFPPSLRYSRAWATACENEAFAALDLGSLEQALQLFEESESVRRDTGAHHTSVMLLPGKARVLCRMARIDEAIVAARQAVDYSEQGRDPPLSRANAYHALAMIARQHEVALPEGSLHHDAAIHYMELALAELSLSQGTGETGAWLVELSQDYERVGDYPNALACGRRATQADALAQRKRAADLATSLQVRHEIERTKAELAHHKALAEAEAAANRAKSTFLANMSHELRSPLNAMLGFARLMLRDPLFAARQDELNIVLRSGEHLYRLINQVLDMSKVEAGRLVLNEYDFDLHALLAEVHELFAAPAGYKGVALHVRAGHGVPAGVRGDAVKLKQVLINLVSNALKFTRQGQVEVAVMPEQGQRLAFEVQDTGVGIAAHDLARLGQAFAQAEAGRHHADGTGLGLAISKGFLELMGGKMDINSEPGLGTTVRFSLPLRPVDLAASPAQDVANRLPVALAEGTPPPRVLLVDDSAEGRLLLRRLLEPLGFDLREAADGQQAVAIEREWQPALILMDMRMPILDGEQATRLIKARDGARKVVVVALTASSFEEEREEILRAGCDDFIRKPFDEAHLLQVLARHLALEYRYDADPVSSSGASSRKELVGRLRRMSGPLRRQLEHALDELDVQEVERVLQILQQTDPECARELLPLARRFAYGRIRDLLG